MDTSKYFSEVIDKFFIDLRSVASTSHPKELSEETIKTISPRENHLLLLQQHKVAYDEHLNELSSQYNSNMKQFLRDVLNR